MAPLHFYGELVKTAEGRMILEAKGHFGQFVDVIRTHGMESSDLEVIAKLKSVLWAVVGGVFLQPEQRDDRYVRRVTSALLLEVSNSWNMKVSPWTSSE